MAKLDVAVATLLVEATITATVPHENEALKIILTEALCQVLYDWDAVVEAYCENTEDPTVDPDVVCPFNTAVGLIRSLLQQLKEQEHGSRSVRHRNDPEGQGRV